MVTYKGYRGKSALQLMAMERAQGVSYESGRINPYSKNVPFATRATPAMQRAARPGSRTQAQVRTDAIVKTIYQAKDRATTAKRSGGVMLRPLGLSSALPPKREIKPPGARALPAPKREISHPGDRALPKPRPAPRPAAREIAPPGPRALPRPRPPVSPPKKPLGITPKKTSANPVGGALMAGLMVLAALASFRKR